MIHAFDPHLNIDILKILRRKKSNRKSNRNKSGSNRAIDSNRATYYDYITSAPERIANINALASTSCDVNDPNYFGDRCAADNLNRRDVYKTIKRAEYYKRKNDELR